MSPQPVVPNPGRYWSGVGFTAVLAGLAALVAVLAVDDIGGIDLLAPWPWTTVKAGYVVDAVAVAVLAAGLLYLLFQTAPRPRMFFGWIGFLATAAVVLLVFRKDVTWRTKIGTGSVVAFIALVIMVTLSSIGDRTLVPVDRQVRAPQPGPLAQPGPPLPPPSRPAQPGPPQPLPPPWSDR